MKTYLIAAAVAAAIAVPALASDVGVSLSIGQPGFYGQIDIGDYGRPQLMYRQPVMVERVPMDRAPVYLHVPPGHAKHWRDHCREYNACGERVYFVQDNWYNREYVPRYQSRHGDRRDDRHDDRGDHHGDRGNDNHGDRGNDHRGNDHQGRDH